MASQHSTVFRYLEVGTSCGKVRILNSVWRLTCLNLTILIQSIIKIVNNYTLPGYSNLV